MKNIRKIIYAISILTAAIEWAAIVHRTPASSLQTIRLVEAFGLTSLILLYITLLISPLYYSLPSFPGHVLFVRARRALGVSAFFFALLHTNNALFGLLGGFYGFAFLTVRYQQATLLGFGAFLILCALAATSFDGAERWLGKRWKTLHRLVYAAGILILIHVLMLGAHYTDLFSPWAQTTLWAMMILFFLEARRLDDALGRRWPVIARRRIVSFIMVIVMGLGGLWIYGPWGKPSSLNIHAQHIHSLD